MQEICDHCATSAAAWCNRKSSLLIRMVAYILQVWLCFFKEEEKNIIDIELRWILPFFVQISLALEKHMILRYQPDG